jgi:hypothetical protein
MSTQYKWPDGTYHAAPYIRTKPAAGLLRIIRKFMFCWYAYDKVVVTIHLVGNKAVRVETGLPLVKQAAHEKGNPKRRYSSK